MDWKFSKLGREMKQIVAWGYLNSTMINERHLDKLSTSTHDLNAPEFQEFGAPIDVVSTKNDCGRVNS